MHLEFVLDDKTSISLKYISLVLKFKLSRNLSTLLSKKSKCIESPDHLLPKLAYKSETESWL